MDPQPSTSSALTLSSESNIDYIPDLLAAIQTIIDLQASCISNLARTARNRNRNKNKKGNRVNAHKNISEATARQRRELTDLLETSRYTIQEIVELISSIKASQKQDASASPGQQ